MFSVRACESPSLCSMHSAAPCLPQFSYSDCALAQDECGVRRSINEPDNRDAGVDDDHIYRSRSKASRQRYIDLSKCTCTPKILPVFSLHCFDAFSMWLTLYGTRCMQGMRSQLPRSWQMQQQSSPRVLFMRVQRYVATHDVYD